MEASSRRSRGNDDPADESMKEEKEEEEEVQQIRVTFRLAPECAASFKVPTDVIAVPASIGRRGLSAVIHHLLEPNDDTKEESKSKISSFEFLLSRDHWLSGTTLERLARRVGASLEAPLELLYFPTPPPPEPAPPLPLLPDWLSCLAAVAGPQQNWLGAGGYDGSLVLVALKDDDPRAPRRLLRPVHTGPIHALAMVQAKNHTIHIATGSMDQTLLWHQYTPETDASFTTRKCGGGHAAAIVSVDLYYDSSAKEDSSLRLASGDWDGTVCLWDSGSRGDGTGIDAPTTTKRSRMSSSSDAATPMAADAPTEPLSPRAIIPAHAGPVSGVAWTTAATTHAQQLITASWDHSIKVWDVERQDCLVTRNGQRVITGIDPSAHTPGLVAAGHPDGTVRLWDLRTSEDAVAVAPPHASLVGHEAYVSAVRWSPRDPYQIAAGSYDGRVRLWDVRVPGRPRFTSQPPLQENGGKKLCLCYNESGDTLFSGGTDGALASFRLS